MITSPFIESAALRDWLQDARLTFAFKIRHELFRFSISRQLWFSQKSKKMCWLICRLHGFIFYRALLLSPLVTPLHHYDFLFSLLVKIMVVAARRATFIFTHDTAALGSSAFQLSDYARPPATRKDKIWRKPTAPAIGLWFMHRALIAYILYSFRFIDDFSICCWAGSIDRYLFIYMPSLEHFHFLRCNDSFHISLHVMKILRIPVSY